MDRREKILENLDLARLNGVEIGPLSRPLVRKSEGDIIYVDYADAETLKNKYREDPNVSVDDIVEVDAIWGVKTLQQAIGEERKVDYVIASHVIEHVPDMIGWLEELDAVLAPRGEIRLAIPDRRFTFDYLRRELSVAELVAARLLRARVPQPQAVLEFLTYFTDVNPVSMWTGELDPRRLKPNNGILDAIGLGNVALSGGYVDVHCWVFTPRSFGLALASLVRAGLLKLQCTSFHDTAERQHEFFVALSHCDLAERAAKSWDRMSAAVRVEVPGSPEGREVELIAANNALKAQIATLAAASQRNAEIASALRFRTEAIEASMSWRLTTPLRALSSWLSTTRMHQPAPDVTLLAPDVIASAPDVISSAPKVTPPVPPTLTPTPLSRTERLLTGIDIDREVGLEIGPLDRPLVPRNSGRPIYYADYAPRETLRENSRNDPHVDCDKIPEIDYLIAPPPKRLEREFDYIIASHVAEHVPDFLGWFVTLSGWLRPGGRIVLAIPDRRHCFDYLRTPSTVGQLIEAYVAGRTQPTVANIYDGFRLALHFDVPQSWQSDPSPPYDHIYSPEVAFSLAEAAHRSGKYQDCHCWVFTYDSFVAAIDEINALGIVKICIERAEAPVFGSNEFHVVLSPRV